MHYSSIHSILGKTEIGEILHMQTYPSPPLPTNNTKAPSWSTGPIYKAMCKAETYHVSPFLLEARNRRRGCHIKHIKYDREQLNEESPSIHHQKQV